MVLAVGIEPTLRPLSGDCFHGGISSVLRPILATQALFGRGYRNRTRTKALEAPFALRYNNPPELLLDSSQNGEHCDYRLSLPR